MQRVGAKCSLQGRQYERDIAHICKLFQSPFLSNDIPLHTQHDYQLGGCTAKQDLYLNVYGIEDIGIEIKRKTPDWMQMSIIPNDSEYGKWMPTHKHKIPPGSRDIFQKYLDDIIFPIPPFITRSITYDEWQEYKHEFRDQYHNIPNTTIALAYAMKNTKYIQLHGYGLYHTGEDVCNFGVPMFECDQRMRIRCKRHGKKDATGRDIPSSVTVSFTPRYKTLTKSPFSLDSKHMFPRMFTHL